MRTIDPLRNQAIAVEPVDDSGPSDRYDSLPLAGIAACIVNASDRAALNVFHERRTPFRYAGSQPLRFIEFVDRLRESRQARTWTDQDAWLLDRAYDLTVGKFSHLPPDDIGPDESDRVGSSNRVKRQGPDCRYYFMAYLEHISARPDIRRECDPLRQEIMSAKALQDMVYRHFRLSCRECRRNGNPLVRRFAWRNEGRAVSLYFPVAMTGKQCRQWLTDHLDAGAGGDPLEHREIQALIDRELNGRAVVSLDDYDLSGLRHPQDDPHFAAAVTDSVTLRGLPRTVADEKAMKLDQQRPAIRALGPKALKRMILRIFEGIESDGDLDRKLAQEFGLSAATFSRFAGRRWAERSSGGQAERVPDLWANTATVLAAYPDFREAAMQAGVWRRIDRIRAWNEEQDHGS